MKIKKHIVTIMLLIAFSLTGCGNQSTVKLIEEKQTYPEPETVAANLEEAGFEVERFDSFEELGIEALRIKALKDDEYIDICYNVPSENDLDAVIEYYMGNYEKYNLVSNVDLVFCYSSENVVKEAGLQ